MVEGPGCKLKGEKLRSRVRGQKLQKSSGNAVEKGTKKSNKDGPDSHSPFDDLIGKTLTDIQTLGKELFIYFEEKCIRIHFLMAGYFVLNGQNIDEDHGRKQPQTTTLRLELSQDVVEFFKTGVEIRNSIDCQEKFERMKHLDICSMHFNQKDAIEAVMSQDGRQICDVLLDQDILPGVGNIIKNEALFDSGINPVSLVKDLTQKHVSHLVQMTRDFSMLFYQCRKTGKPLQAHMKVYRKGTCQQCQGKVITTKTGENPRMTCYCPHCQDSQLKEERKLPNKNSLIGWVTTATTSGKSQLNNQSWTCQICTLINEPQRTTCNACLTPKVVPAAKSQPPDINLPTMNTHIGGATKNAEPSSGLKRKINSENNNTETKRLKSETISTQSSTISYGSNIRPTRSVNVPNGNNNRPSGSVNLPNGSNSQPNGSNNRPNGSNNRPNGSNNRPTGFAKFELPLCKGHKKPCYMREVRKEGDTKKRVFFSCSMGRNKSCNYFQWADEKFPLCEGHNKRCVIRTVLKEGTNNGRKFFACQENKKKSCSYFKWADEYNDIKIS